MANDQNIAYSPSEMASIVKELKIRSLRLQNKTINVNGNVVADSGYDALGTVTVDIGIINSYSASDEGKVVSNGELIGQASSFYSENGIYDTTLIDEIELSVSIAEDPQVRMLIDGTISSLYESRITELSTFRRFLACSNLTTLELPACEIVREYFPGSIAPLAAWYTEKGDLTTIILQNCRSIGVSAFNTQRRLTTVLCPMCETIDSYAFNHCSSLTSASFPACKTIGSYAFFSCTSLANVNFPVCETIGESAFMGCTSLSEVNFPACTTINDQAFFYCSGLQTVSLPACTKIVGTGAFQSCTALRSLYLLGGSFVDIRTRGVFDRTPLSDSSYLNGEYGSIYVPASLYNTYINAYEWNLYSSRFVSVY